MTSGEGTVRASLTLASAAPALAFATLLVFSVPLFAVRSWTTRERGAERRSAARSLGHWPRDWLLWLVSPFERAFIGASLSPDLFNFLGLGFGVAAGVAFGVGALGLAGWLVLLGGVCDVLDGRVARGRRIASPYGAFLDSTLDRFAEAFVYVGVGWRLSHSPAAAALTVLALGGSMLVSYARARGEALGFACTDGVMQRAQRLVLLAVAALLDAPLTTAAGWPPLSVLTVAVGVIGVGAVGTAVQRTILIARGLRRPGARREVPPPSPGLQ